MKNKKSNLTIKQQKFIDKYMELGNGTQAYIEAGYKATSPDIASANAIRLLANEKVATEITKRREAMKSAAIATAEEVMEYFSRVMRGEEKDQFGLDAPLSERTRAAQELARRTVDIENRIQGKADAEVKITLDWSGFSNDND